MIKMKILAAQESDTHQGWIWLRFYNPPPLDNTNPSLDNTNPPFDLPPRGVLKITNLTDPNNRKSVHCEALKIDQNFINLLTDEKRKDQISNSTNPLLISEWYRARLGIDHTKSNIELDIVVDNLWFGQFLACVDHPQIAIRLTAWISGISLLLSVIGFVLGVYSVAPGVIGFVQGVFSPKPLPSKGSQTNSLSIGSNQISWKPGTFSTEKQTERHPY